MPFTNVLKKLDNIGAVAGKNDKRALLKNYLNTDETFAEVVKLMLSEDVRFKIKELPTCNGTECATGPTELFKYLNTLAKKKGVNDADKQKLADLAGNGATREVVERIVNKDPKVGFGLTSITRVAPWLLFQTPYQRCSGIKNADRVQMPGITQKKADGMFAYVSPGFTKDLFQKMFLTRRGKSFDLLGELEEEIAIYVRRLEDKFPDPVLVGELTLLEEDGTVMPRKKGNGILNSFIKGMGNAELAQRVIYSVWDVLPGADFRDRISVIPYGERWKALQEAYTAEPTKEEAALFMRNALRSGTTNRVKLIESEPVENMVEAQKFYDRMRDQGEEGAILKDLSSIWKDNPCPTFVKMKHFAQAEFEITGVVEGKGKYAGMMGALEYRTSDGIITGSVGSGFSDAERQDMEFWEKSIGKIITLQFESVISDKKTDAKSLFIPTFVEARFNEKTEADTAAYVEAL